jgi:hypothetical protein
MNEPMGDVWKLEGLDDDYAWEDLQGIIDKAVTFHGVHERSYLRKLWDNESWKSVKEKLYSEGSTWYVWWMDGVRAHRRILEKIQDMGGEI